MSCCGTMRGVTAPSPGGMVTGVTTTQTKRNLEFKGGKNDIEGLIMLEIQGADDLPQLANSVCFFFRSSFQPFIFFFSDPYVMGHRRLRRHLCKNMFCAHVIRPVRLRKAMLPRP